MKGSTATSSLVPVLQVLKLWNLVRDVVRKAVNGRADTTSFVYTSHFTSLLFLQTLSVLAQQLYLKLLNLGMYCDTYNMVGYILSKKGNFLIIALLLVFSGSSVFSSQRLLPPHSLFLRVLPFPSEPEWACSAGGVWLSPSELKQPFAPSLLRNCSSCVPGAVYVMHHAARLPCCAQGPRTGCREWESSCSLLLHRHVFLCSWMLVSILINQVFNNQEVYI